MWIRLFFFFFLQICNVHTSFICINLCIYRYSDGFGVLPNGHLPVSEPKAEPTLVSSPSASARVGINTQNSAGAWWCVLENTQRQEVPSTQKRQLTVPQIVVYRTGYPQASSAHQPCESILTDTALLLRTLIRNPTMKTKRRKSKRTCRDERFHVQRATSHGRRKTRQPWLRTASHKDVSSRGHVSKRVPDRTRWRNPTRTPSFQRAFSRWENESIYRQRCETRTTSQGLVCSTTFLISTHGG